MGFLWALLGFAVTIGIIVLVHEAGHLLAAKSLNVEVRRFSIGFGPVLWKKKWGETEYAVSLVPLGGYVQMTGENGTAEPLTEAERARSYDAQSKPRRAMILAREDRRRAGGRRRGRCRHGSGRRRNPRLHGPQSLASRTNRRGDRSRDSEARRREL